MHKGFQVLVIQILMFVAGLMITSCSKDEDNTPTGPTSPWQAENSTCVSSVCHGNANLSKSIVVTGGATEVVPLYVDSVEFLATVHRGEKCVSCHTDIESSGGIHGAASKKFGGWARFSTKSGTVQQATTDSTRNYITAASEACKNCHAEQHNSEAAHIRIPRLHTSIRDFQGHSVGENYEDNNCGRCHAACGTCHFESTITNADGTPDDLLTSWDLIQTIGDNAIPNTGPKTEWRMDWTTNVRSHNIRSSADLAASNEVCQSCHIGFYRPAQLGFAMRDGGVDSMYATGIKRHPQVQELALATVHSSNTCVSCHGPSLHDQVSIEDGPECFDCHAGKDVNHPSVNHAAYGIECIACHTKQRASDFADGYQSGGQSNWINPENGLITPVTVKYSELLNWYPHRFSETVDCMKLCHFVGNRVEAPVFPGVEPQSPSKPRGPIASYTPSTMAGETDE